MNKQGRHFADHEKVAILKRHLIDKVPVSDLCDELDLYPNQFYDWLKRFFENGHLAFANGRQAKAVEDANVQKIHKLEDKLTRKNEVMAELMDMKSSPTSAHASSATTGRSSSPRISRNSFASWA
jgi:transposase-like protein